MRSGRLKAFDADRAKTDRASTSRLSPHIHYGEVSVRHMHYVAKHQQLEWARCVVAPWRGGMLGGCVPWRLHAGQPKHTCFGAGSMALGSSALSFRFAGMRHAACLVFPLLQVGGGRHQRARLPAAAGLPRVSSCSRCFIVAAPAAVASAAAATAACVAVVYFASDLLHPDLGQGVPAMKIPAKHSDTSCARGQRCPR